MYVVIVCVIKCFSFFCNLIVEQEAGVCWSFGFDGFAVSAHVERYGSF